MLTYKVTRFYVLQFHKLKLSRESVGDKVAGEENLVLVNKIAAGATGDD